MKNIIKIRQATKQGYIECELPGVADFGFPKSKTRRGRVQARGQICPTLMAENSMILVIEPNIDLDNMEIKDVGKHE